MHGIDDIELNGEYVWNNPEEIVSSDSEYTMIFVPEDTNYSKIDFDVKISIEPEQHKPETNKPSKDKNQLEHTKINKNKDLSKTGTSIFTPMLSIIIFFILLDLLVYSEKTR